MDIPISQLREAIAAALRGTRSVRGAVMDAVRDLGHQDANSAGMFLPAPRALADSAESAMEGGASERDVWHNMLAWRHPVHTNNEWATELSDEGAQLRPGWNIHVNDHGYGDTNLGAILDHQPLYNWALSGGPARQQLPSTDFQFDPSTFAGFGVRTRPGGRPPQKYFMASPDLLHGKADTQPVPALLHEIQHWVQEGADWPRGTSPEHWSTRGTPEQNADFYNRLIADLRDERDRNDFHFRSTGDPAGRTAADDSDKLLRMAQTLSVLSPEEDHRYEMLPRFWRYATGNEIQHINNPNYGRGEQLARWTEKRAHMNAQERQALFPEDTPDSYTRDMIRTFLRRLLKSSVIGGGLGLSYGAAQNALRNDGSA